MSGEGTGAGTGSHAAAETETGPSPRRPVPLWAIVATVAAVLAALVILLATSGSSDGADTSGQIVGSPAPELVGVTTSGQEFDLADTGGWAVVNFFATWCPPCVAEHPELVAFDSRNDDATVVSVAFDEPADVIESFFDDNGGDWPVVADAKGIPLDWGVVKLPESFLVAPDGTVVEKLEGGIEATELEQLIAGHESGSGDGG